MKSERVVLVVALLLCLGVAVAVVLLLVPSLPEVVASWSADSEFCPFAGAENDGNGNYFEGRPRVEVHFGGVLVEWDNVERSSDKCIVEYAVEYGIKDSGRAPARKILSKYHPDTDESTNLRDSAMIPFVDLKKLARSWDLPKLDFSVRVIVVHRYHPNATHEESTSSGVTASFSIMCPKTTTRSYGRMWRNYGNDVNPYSPVVTPISCIRKEKLVKVRIQWRVPECLVASEGHFVVLHWPNIGKGHLVSTITNVVKVGMNETSVEQLISTQHRYYNFQVAFQDSKSHALQPSPITNHVQQPC